jgi:hypothetical protein
MPQENLDPTQSTTSVIGCILKGCGIVLALMMVLALVPSWIYLVDSHHSSRASILWPSRGRGLIPPTATDITLQRDLLDHWATYTVSEEDLNAFLDERFRTRGIGGDLDSYRERGPADRERFMTKYADLGWVWTEEMVQYHYTTDNGAGSSYYHDPTTGLTYQDSAYW